MKVIGISGNHKHLDGFNRDYVLDNYSASIKKMGVAPIILPVTSNEQIVEVYVDKIDALIMTGGVDVNPALYGEEIKAETEEPFDKRDSFDFMLIKYALKKGIPILGICRGMQIINTYFNGSLHQDIKYHSETEIEHMQDLDYFETVHDIKIKKDSILHGILGDTTSVNSIHHQCINKLGEGLKIAATSTDDHIIEAYESDEHKILGIQWHPEIMFAHGNKSMQDIFKFLIGSL